MSLSVFHTYAHMQLFCVALCQPHPVESFPSLSAERCVCVCLSLCVCRRGRTEASRKEMNRCSTHGPPAEPNHVRCLNIYLWVSHWQRTKHSSVIYEYKHSLDLSAFSSKYWSVGLFGPSSYRFKGKDTFALCISSALFGTSLVTL